MERHKDEISKHVAGFESDLGSTKFVGIGHQGPGKEIVDEIQSKYLSLLNATKY